MDRSRVVVGALLGAGLVLAVATPWYVGVSNGLETYLRHPAVFAMQAVPYLLAAALWLPVRTPRLQTIGLVVAWVMLVAAVLVYLPMLTGWFPMGGDMVALAFLFIEVVTVVVVLVVTLVAHVVVRLLLGHRGRDSRVG
jgi:hypothetical protein